VDTVHRKDLKVNGKIKTNLRKIACGDNDPLMAVHRNRIGFHKICNSAYTALIMFSQTSIFNVFPVSLMEKEMCHKNLQWRAF
jgi:hypothetical protein